MATYDEVMAALRNADAAGDTEAASRLAEKARELKGIGIPQQGMTEPIPGDNPNRPYNPELKEQSIVDKYLGSFLTGMAGVPILAGAARGGAALLSATRFAKPAAEIARSVMPASGRALAIEGVGGGVAGVAGQMAGETQDPGWKRDIAGAVAGAAVGVPFSVAATTGRLISSDSLTGAKEFIKDGADAYGRSKANKAAQVAVNANPNLVPSVVRASELSQFLGQPLPALAQANGDTTISGYINSQIARGENAAFTAEIRNKYIAAENALKAKSNSLAPSMEDVEAFVRTQAVKDELADQAAQKTFEAQSVKRQGVIDNLTTQLRSIGEQMESAGKEDIGKRLTNVITARETAIQKEMSPKIEKIINDAENAGVKLSGSVAADLRRYTLNEENSKVFQTFPKLFGMLQKTFAPKESSKLVNASGKRFDASTQDFSIRDLDSLKIRVNEDLRNADPKSSEYRILAELKDKVYKAIDSTDPAFSKPYKAVQDEYYQRLGIPYRNSEGVMAIERAKFVENTVPLLTTKASSLREALTAMGDTPEAHKIATDAFMLKLSQTKSILKNDGEINPVALNRYVAENADKINLVPGLRKQLEGLVGNTQKLVNARAGVLELQKTAQRQKFESLWSQAYSSADGLQGVVRQALSVPKKMDQLLAVTSKDPDALQAVRGALIDDLLKAQGDRTALFSKHSEAINKIYGKDIADDLEKLVEISQRLKANPFDSKIQPNTVTKTNVQKQTGSSPEQLAGELRNPILSAPRKVFNVISRYFTNSSRKAEDMEMQRLLLNPDILIQAKSFVEEVDTKGFTDKAQSIAMQLMKNQGFVMATSAAGYAGATTSDKKATPFTVSDPTLLEGFGK
jgi:cell pole-organizing protein PopZ